VILSILVLAVYVTLWPNVVYAPTPRIVLYFLMSVFLAIVLGTEAAANFRFTLPGFAITCAGAAGAVFGLLFLLTYLSKPEEKIAVFHVYDENGGEVNLQFRDALKVLTTQSGETVTHFEDGNTLVFIFPEQVAEVELQVRSTSTGPVYSGTVGYGRRKPKLQLGDDLKIRTTKKSS
jgi:hypothetical protein